MINYFSLLALIVATIALVVSVLVLWRLRELHALRKNFAGSSLDLEEILNAITGNAQALEHKYDNTAQELRKLQHESKFSIQNIGIVWFNPFGDSGGNFSFSLALLNGHGTGVVITSMHGRQQNRIYTKRIEQENSESPLTDEEKKAVALALNKNL